MTGVFLGQMNPGLSAVGREQCRLLAELKAAVVWCSPLLRARQTADCICAKKKIVLRDLRELDYGDWTGKSWVAIEAGWPELARLKSANWLGVTPPGGEAWGEFLERVRGAWLTILKGPSPAVVVAHQGVNSALAFLIDGRDPLRFTQAYGEVIRVEY